eukprot:5620168-Pleurochrysis_carterae.AAC.6
MHLYSRIVVVPGPSVLHAHAGRVPSAHIAIPAAYHSGTINKLLHDGKTACPAEALRCAVRI